MNRNQKRRCQRHKAKPPATITTSPPPPRRPTAPPIPIIDYTPSRWAPHIQRALAILDPLLPGWYPLLQYRAGGPRPCGEVVAQERSVVICEASATPVAGAWAVTEFAPRDPIPTATMILARFANPNPTLIIHELHHALTGEVEHSGWERRNPPFDPSKLSRQPDSEETRA